VKPLNVLEMVAYHSLSNSFQNGITFIVLLSVLISSANLPLFSFSKNEVFNNIFELATHFEI
jgi:hypothetical protein